MRLRWCLGFARSRRSAGSTTNWRGPELLRVGNSVQSFGFGFRAPKKVEGHPLVGHMVDTEEDDVREMLERHPATVQELMLLGLEEMHGRDRPAIYRLFAEFKP